MRRASTVGAYACPSTIRMTTSPGIRRMIEKTITLTSTSVGTASASRRRTYCLMEAYLSSQVNISRYPREKPSWYVKPFTCGACTMYWGSPGRYT